MKVKFANTEVEDWKLRKGTVIADYNPDPEMPTYYHIESFSVVKGIPNTTWISAKSTFDTRWSCSTSFAWLEPH